MEKDNDPTPMYVDLLDGAARIARERGDSFVGPVHLALAMVGDPQSELAFILGRQMGVDVDELARRLRWTLDRPHGGPGQHEVAALDGATIIRDNETLEVVQTWTPAGDSDVSGR